MIPGMDDTSECSLLTSRKGRELISWCRDSGTARAKKNGDTCVLEAELHKNDHTNSAAGAMLLGGKLLTGEVSPDNSNAAKIVHCKLDLKEEKVNE